MAHSNSRLPATVRIACRRAASLLLGFALSATASAGSFQVNPIRIELSKGITTAVVTVRNDGEEAVVLQSSVLGWTQEGGDLHADHRAKPVARRAWPRISRKRRSFAESLI